MPSMNLDLVVTVLIWFSVHANWWRKPQNTLPKCSFFVDLQKAYNSVPRSAMWLVLQKYSVLCGMIQLPSWGLRDNMKVEVPVAGESAQIQVCNVGTNTVLAVFQYGHVAIVLERQM